MVRLVVFCLLPNSSLGVIINVNRSKVHPTAHAQLGTSIPVHVMHVHRYKYCCKYAQIYIYTYGIGIISILILILMDIYTLILISTFRKLVDMNVSCFPKDPALAPRGVWRAALRAGTSNGVTKRHAPRQSRRCHGGWYGMMVGMMRMVVVGDG